METGYDFFVVRNRLLLELAERMRRARESGQKERARGRNSALEDFQARTLRMYRQMLKEGEPSRPSTGD